MQGHAKVSAHEVIRFLGLYRKDRKISLADGLSKELSSLAPRSAMTNVKTASPYSRIAVVFNRSSITKKYKCDAWTEMRGGCRVGKSYAGNDLYDEVIVNGLPEKIILWRSGCSAREIRNVEFVAKKAGIPIEFR